MRRYECVGGAAEQVETEPGGLTRLKNTELAAGVEMEAFQKYFGEYSFKRDGYKLIEAPYSGMEHQSAVTYGNRFANGYLERDWTGVGVSLKFDFIIIHESAHEWFGNSITGSDISDMWIQEGWATYAECVYVEALFVKEDALKYVNGYKTKVRNRQPIITKLCITSKSSSFDPLVMPVSRSAKAFSGLARRKPGGR